MSSASTPVVRQPGARHLALAWWSVLTYPLVILAAFLVGQGVPLWMGYDVATTEAPWWVMLLAFAAAIATILLPLPFTAHFSRKAREAGRPGARVPLLVALAMVGGAVVITLFSGFMLLIFE